MKTYPVIRPYDKKPFSFHMSNRNIMLFVLFAVGSFFALEFGAEEQKSDSGYYKPIEPYRPAKPLIRKAPPPAPEKPADVHQLTSDAAVLVGIRPSLLHAMVMIESTGRQSARSPKGAIGLMQLMPDTAKELGVNPHDVAENIAGGAVYLKRWLDKYRDDTLALIAYNQGPGATDRWLAKGGNWKKLPKETRDYVSKVNVNATLAERATQLAMGGR
jgi:soluble lytic murein transglycosylase-like protein